MRSDRSETLHRRATERRLGLEGRRTLPAQLRSATGSGRRGVFVGAAATAGVAAAVLVGMLQLSARRAAEPTSGGMPGSEVGATIGAVVVAVLGGIAVAGLSVYVVARVFLILDVRRLPHLAWHHDGILLRHTGSDPEPVGPDLVVPLRAAADAAEVRSVWAVVIGWAQCVVGAALLVVVVLGMLSGNDVPWILAVVTFIVGGLGQDTAARSTRTLGRVVEARRSATAAASDESDATTGHSATSTTAVSTTSVSTTSVSAPSVSTTSVSRSRPRGRAAAAPSGSGSRTARRMPPRAPGRGSSLELPGE